MEFRVALRLARLRLGRVATGQVVSGQQFCLRDDRIALSELRVAISNNSHPGDTEARREAFHGARSSHTSTIGRCRHPATHCSAASWLSTSAREGSELPSATRFASPLKVWTRSSARISAATTRLYDKCSRR